ncbi:MAG: thiol:disulfide interchange protein DsbA/DsbL [Pseudomonadales bacterium]
MTSRADRKVTRARNTIIAFVTLIAIMVIGYGTVYTSGVGSGDLVDHYRIVEDPPRRRAGEPILVQEFFSYACVHCRNFDPLVEDWKDDIPDGVVFDRSPVAFSPIWQLLAQTYFTLNSLGALEANHLRLFRAIHDNGRQFLSVEMIADYIDGNGTTKEEFLRAFNSPAVRQSVQEAQDLQNKLVITSVPTLAVSGKYVVNMDVGRKASLDIVDQLIALEKNEDLADRAAGELDP